MPDLFREIFTELNTKAMKKYNDLKWRLNLVYILVYI